MENEELENWSSRIQQSINKEDAFLGLYIYGGAADESHIKANKEGLLLFAEQFIRAAIEIEKPENKGYVYLEDDECVWLDGKSDIWLDYVTSTHFKNRPTADDSSTWQENLVSYTILAFGIFLIAMVLLGIKTLFS